MIFIIKAMLAGIMIILSRIINYNVSVKSSIFNSVFVNNVSAVIFASLLISIFGPSNIKSLQNAQWWMYLGGAIAIFVLFIQTFLVPRISAVVLTILTFVGQLSMSLLIDLLTGYEMSLKQLFGLVIIFIGMMIVVKPNLIKKNLFSKISF